MFPNDSWPRVFVSFAGEDRPTALRLAADLKACGVSSFIDVTGIQGGEDIVWAIDNALTQSDYFVLLWSSYAADRAFVRAELSAALMRELNERRSFLFVLRLDDTPMPTLLAPRKFLDASDGWEMAVVQLTTAWNRDRSLGMPVLPTPEPPEFKPADRARTAISLYVYNEHLRVSYQLTESATATGPVLLANVLKRLRLREHNVKINELITVGITYDLEFGGRRIVDQPLTEQGLTDNSKINLLVSVDDVAAAGNTLSTRIYRLSTVDPETEAKVIDAEFNHLRPY